MKKAIWEAIKEPLRILVLAIIPVILAYLEVINTQWAIIIVAVLRLADKVLHDVGKTIENEKLEGGITRF